MNPRNAGTTNYNTVQFDGWPEKIGGLDVTVLQADDNGDVLFCKGSVVPVSGTPGYGQGCTFVNESATPGSPASYVNNGTGLYCVFEIQGSSASSVSATVGFSDADYICDGTADDVQLNAAIAAVYASGGGTVLVKQGNYNLSSSVTMLSGVYVSGTGYATLINIPATKRIAFDMVQNCGIRDLRTDAFSQAPGDISIQIKNASNVTIERIYVGNAQGFGVFIESNASLTCEKVSISGCTMYGLGNNDLIGGGPSNSTGATVTDVNVSGNFLQQSYSLGHTYEFVFDIVAARRISFNDNFCVGKVSFGFEQFPHFMDDFSNNVLKPALGGTFTQIIMQANASSSTSARGLTVVGNRVESGEIRLIGVASKKITNAIVCGNVVNSITSQNGIGLESCSLSSCYGNTCIGSGNASGVFLTGSDNTTVFGNVISTYSQGVNDASSSSSVSIFNNTLNNIAVTTIIGGGITRNNMGANPEKLFAQGNITGATTFTRVNGDVITATFTGNVTTTVMNGISRGDKLTLQLTQGAGANTISKPANVKLVGGAFSPSAAAGAVDTWTLEWDGTSWNELSRALNIS